MCAPMIGILGAAVSAMGTMAQASGQAAGHKYNAAVAKVNAENSRREGFKESERIGRSYDRLGGQQRAAVSAAGVDPFFGSALDLFEDTSTRRQGDQAANYLKAESTAVNFENEARREEMAAKNAKKAGMIGAASSFLGGLTKPISSGFGSSLGATG